MNKFIIEDLIVNTELYFKQIIALLDLMLEVSDVDSAPNLMTLKELAESDLNKIKLVER